MSTGGTVAIRCSGVGGSLVITEIVDLNLGYSKQCSDLDNLRRLWESIQLVSSDGQIGARCLLDILVANAKKF